MAQLGQSSIIGENVGQERLKLNLSPIQLKRRDRNWLWILPSNTEDAAGIYNKYCLQSTCDNNLQDSPYDWAHALMKLSLKVLGHNLFGIKPHDTPEEHNAHGKTSWRTHHTWGLLG
ncbi:hypothetical protein GOODEAATRI_031025 [Goodea atripinnis]|uniref:Uncharacterized protein n=1 Tax=Goodea atripinnis TaxID=208336 RepID=A0ABV0P987_9TELE